MKKITKFFANHVYVKIAMYVIVATLVGGAGFGIAKLTDRNEPEFVEIDNGFLAGNETDEQSENNSVEEAVSISSEEQQETEPLSTEDEKLSEVETSVVPNTTEQSDVSGTKETESVVRPHQDQIQQPSPSQAQTAFEPSENQSVQTQPSQTQQSTSNSAQTQPSQNQQTQTQPSQTTPQVLVPVGVTIAPTPGGKTTVNGQDWTIIYRGMIATLVADPLDGYEFDAWYVDGVQYSTMNPVLIQPQKSIGVHATYKKIVPPPSDDTGNNGGNNSSSSNPSESKPQPKPEEKKEVYRLRVAVENGDGGTLRVTENDEILLNEIHNYQYTKIKEGRRVTVTANPFANNAIKCWIVDGKEISLKTNTYTFTASADCDIVVVFEEKTAPKMATLKVTTGGSGEGFIEIDGERKNQVTLLTDTEVKVEAIGRAGSHFESWNDGVKDNPRTIKLTSDMSLVATFEKDDSEPEKTVEIKLYAQEGGSVTFNGQTVTTEETFVVPKGTEVPMNANPEKDHRFIGYEGDTQYINGTSASAILKADADICLTAKFEKRTEYALTLRMEGGDGTVTLDGKSVNFVNGIANVKVTASQYELETTPKAGYRFGSYKNAHGVVITTNPKRTITIANDTEITVELVNEIERTVTYKVRGSIFHTEYVEPGKAPESFYSEGMDNLGDDVFKGWILKNEDKFFEGVAGSTDFVNSETNEKLSDAVKRITQDSDVTLEASLQPKEVYCTLSLEDSMELVGVHDTKEIDGVVCYRKGSSINVRIKSGYSNPDKPNFDHWEVTGIGMAGMNPEELIFTIHEDTVVTAVWSAQVVEKQPVVTMTTGSVISGKGISDVRVDYEVPEGCKVNQVGILMGVNGGDMQEKVSKNPSNPDATSGFQGWAGLLMEDQMKTGAVVRLQPYIVFVKEGAESRAYGSSVDFDFSEYKTKEIKVENVTINVSSEGDGHVLVNGEEVTEISVPKGSEKTFEAVAHEGSHFVGWSGMDTDANSLTLSVNSNMTIVAIFEEDEEVSEEETEELETEEPTDEVEITDEVESEVEEATDVVDTTDEVESETEEATDEVDTTDEVESEVEESTDVVDATDEVESEAEESTDEEKEPINEDAIAEDNKSMVVTSE